MIITLRARNPQTPKDRVRFSHVDGCFVELRHKETMIDHLNIVSTVIPKTSDEGLFQIQLEASSRGIFRGDRYCFKINILKYIKYFSHINNFSRI